MKAYVLHSINDLRYEDCEIPLLKPNWVLVEVKSSGICSSDIPRIYKNGTYHFPTIPGHEFSGVVKEIGEGVSRKWIKKRVGVFPLIPCKTCRSCIEGKYEMCENYDYIGSRRNGAFSEYVAVPEWNLIEIPSDMDYDEAALLEPLSVALHAIKKTHIQSNCDVAVIGTGMIGISIALWAIAMGAQSATVIGRSSTKRKLVTDNIGLQYIDLNTSEINEKEFDVVVEAVGSSESISRAFQITKREGTICLMGNPSGDIILSQNAYWNILRKQINLVGTWNSSYESNMKCEWTEAISALSEGRISVKKLITHRFDQNNLYEGLELMKNHKESYCKVMTLWNRKETQL